MELPTCPSCGQSVLDDDAVDCPFCGASMSGSPAKRRSPDSAAKKKPAAPSPKPKAETDKPSRQSGKAAASKSGRRGRETVADEDDPFEISAGRAPTDVVKATPKPTKGRLHRVKCPMCDTTGFIPKSAVNKQVRCANDECLVPIFTPAAGRHDSDERQSAQSGDTALAGGGSISPSAGSPFRIYAIAAIILLPLAGGLVWFLSQPATDESSLAKPADIDFSKFGEDDTSESTETSTASTTAAEKTRDPRTEASRLVRRMISTARQEGNRDKTFARRLTADSWFRLGERTEAVRELSQLTTVARQAASGRTWVGIEPRLTDYWQRHAAGDQQLAAEAVEQVRGAVGDVPVGGRLAYETVIGAAAAIAHAGDQKAARDLVTSHDRDRSIITNRDVMSSAAWFQSVSRLRSAGLEPFAVGDVFAWPDPIRTAIAADLAAHRAWDAAIGWSTGQSEKLTVSDSLAVVAEIACKLNAGADAIDRISQAAAGAGPAIGLRVDAVIAGETKNAEALAGCQGRLMAMSAPAAMPMPPLSDLVRSDPPAQNETARIQAAAAAEVARAAAMIGDQSVAEAAIRRMMLDLSSIAPATPTVRRAILELEQNESRVEQRIGKELRITSRQDIASRFRQYRRSLDQLGRIAEMRRLYLMQRLARIIRAGGTDAIEAVMADEATGLKQEVVMDEMARLLAAAALRLSRRIEPIQSPDQALIVPRPSRMQALPEAELSTTIARAWSAADAGKLRDAVRILDGGRQLPGFRESLLNEIIEQAAATAKEPGVVYSAISGLSNPVWREEALQIASRILARRKLTAAAEKWLDSRKVPPTELITAFYGLTLGLLEQPAK